MIFKINDRFLVWTLFIILAIFSVASVVTLRTLTDQTKKLKDAVITSRSNAETINFCILKVSGQVNFQEIPYTSEAIDKAIQDCFIERENKSAETPFATGPSTTTTVKK